MSADILLHVCCGPCAIWPARRLLAEGFRPLGFFYNPNIHPLFEYLQRRGGAAVCAAKTGMDIEFDDAWDIGQWLEKQLACRGSETRCQNCIAWRLRQTAARARELGLGAFSTSLLYSRYQPHAFIRSQGEDLGREFGLEFVYRDFRGDWQAGIDVSREWGLYRQKYCGCVFSENERYAKKLKNLQKSPAKFVDI